LIFQEGKQLEMSATTSIRPRVHGKFIFVGNKKSHVCGVTYGTFYLDEDGNEYLDPEVVERDFAQMAANGLNAVRTYTVPPHWLLDAARRHNLYVMVGLPREQHVAFLDDKKRAQSIEERVGNGVRACAGHPAVLCYAIGNEIPASIVRWYGHRRVERYLERLYRAAKAADPEGLVTYVNYPSTEYLQLPFVDLVCFNVYLESQKRFEAQQMLVLLGSLAHNGVGWARRWLSSQKIQHCGILRMVRDVFHVSGLLRFDASGSVVEIVLNQRACLARSFIRPLQALLLPLYVVVNLGESRMSQSDVKADENNLHWDFISAL
jgi:hypothetical protein